MNWAIGSMSANAMPANTPTTAGMTKKITTTARNQRKCWFVSAASARMALSNSTGSDFC